MLENFSDKLTFIYVLSVISMFWLIDSAFKNPREKKVEGISSDRELREKKKKKKKTEANLEF